MYLSIDFEDYHHDLKRKLGLDNSDKIKAKQMWNKYEKINSFLKNNGKGKGKYATFFCTAILAQKEPNLVKQIAKDGNEIACHYYFHDHLKNQNEMELKKMLLKAKNTLEKVCGSEVRGFRAPYFSINKKDHKQYKIVEEFFDYDSSLHCSSLEELNYFKKRMNLKKLKIIPLYSPSFLNKFRLGGTYLKIFPILYSEKMIMNSLNVGIKPHIYIHPYEFDNSNEFRVRFSELIKLGLPKALYWKLRQKQWLSFKNNSTKLKLASLIKDNPLEGNLFNVI